MRLAAFQDPAVDTPVQLSFHGSEDGKSIQQFAHEASATGFLKNDYGGWQVIIYTTDVKADNNRYFRINFPSDPEAVEHSAIAA